MPDAPIEFLLLAVRPTHARGRVLGADGRIVQLKPVPATVQVLRTLVPGQVLTVVPEPSRGRREGLEGCVTGRRTDLALLGLEPLGLDEQGVWDPAEEYWGEPGASIDPCFLPIIAAGKRLCFEMEQVLPGAQWDLYDGYDPIIEAADRMAVGDRRRARAILHGLLEQDLRCIDAYAHLGNLALNLEEDPGVALGFYQMGADIAELSVPPAAPWVLPWGLVDNRPYFRCLHGLALSLWHLGRFEEAEAVLERMIWLNPTDNQGMRFVLPAVQAREPWTEEEWG
ncbi:MAG: tetratricopeptide repeat protein [Pseudomonadota bacterium]